MNLLNDIENVFSPTAAKKDEAWVVAEIQKGWQELKKLEAEGAQVLQTAAVDVVGAVGWIKDHHSGILAVFQAALQGVALLGSLSPQAAPIVAGATTAIDLATVAIDKLSAGVTAGSTPISTLVNAYQVGNDAAVAVKAALKAISEKSAVVVAPAPAKS